MGQVLRQAQQMQAQLVAAQEELAQRRVDGTAGGGMVTATVTGSGQLVGLVIDPRAVDPEDTETLADLVLAAVTDAVYNADELRLQTMGPLAAGLSAALPGLGL